MNIFAPLDWALSRKTPKTRIPAMFLVCTVLGMLIFIILASILSLFEWYNPTWDVILASAFGSGLVIGVIETIKTELRRRKE